MKVLVIQLARLGDIYSTWPSLRALVRENPEMEVDVLVRPRFQKAMEGLNVVNETLNLPMAELFAKVLDEGVEDDEALAQSLEYLTQFVQSLKDRKYDRIINLSFSPVSSFLVKLLEEEGTEIAGYTRHNDGFLKIPDDASAYFYAQMGVNSSNRFHVNDMFAEVSRVQLMEEDYNQLVSHVLPEVVTHLLGEEDYLCFHIGASDQRKALSKLKIVNFLRRFLASRSEKVVLIGADIERSFADEIYDQVGNDRLINMVGKTSLIDLFPLIQNGKMLIGADSAPIHIASLVATPVYNISNPFVRFWETGPKSKGSRIRYVEDLDLLGSDTMHLDVVGMLDDEVAPDDVVVVSGPCDPYHYVETNDSQSFRWSLIEAIYLGKDFPVPIDLNFVEAVRQLQELNIVSLQQLHAILRKEEHQENMQILGNIDSLVDKIVDMVPEIGPIVKWYQTEKLRVGPNAKAEIVRSYTEIHETLAKILSIYIGDDLTNTQEEMGYEQQAEHRK